MYKKLNKILAGEISGNQFCRTTETEELETIICRLVHGDSVYDDDYDSYDKYSMDGFYN